MSEFVISLEQFCAFNSEYDISWRDFSPYLWTDNRLTDNQLRIQYIAGYVSEL